MKKYLVILVLVTLASGLCGQTWKPRVELLGGKHTIKSLRLKPGTPVIVTSFAYDSLRQSTRFTGKFVEGTPEALRLKLNQAVVSDALPDGVKRSMTYTPGNYPGLKVPEKEILSIPLTDVHDLNYKVVPFDTEFMELGFFIALPVLILSPFACINYKDMTFNAERYKWFALGSTACIAVSIASLTTLGRSKTIHFRESQGNKGKVWKFLKD